MLEQQFQIMLRNAVVVLILMLLALGVADARVPQVGDKVDIFISTPIDSLASMQGEITDIENGFICIYGGRYNEAPVDMCIGIGCIVKLTWK